MINTIKEQNGYLIVDLNISEASLNNSDPFKRELIALLDEKQKKVVIDMSKVEYMDSSFLGALVSSLKHAIALKSDIVLIGLRKDISDLFALIRLDKVFKIYKDFNEVPTT
ncbi:STAS domain-containing protein [Mucilaginibacter gynuensis]|uniref:Anti-sigma factor antagonist n=1 Tax=Mucilaginibacter gynuensis TaxID=1302236 RepID=A0ABP8G2M4_9SPHI